VAVVTGAAQGIGRGVALALAAEGATVIAVDRSPHKELSRPMLASLHGGEIVVKQDRHGTLVAQDAVFRVIVKPQGAVPKADAVIHGSVRIETGLRFIVENFVYRILSVLIRESAF